MNNSLKITIEKTAKIATWGNPKAKNVWFCLHGYGQLSDYFIKGFERLDPEENFVVAPEGLHRFYLRGTSGRVGASWMTKEERLDDISDYVKYLDQVYDEVIDSNLNQKIIVLGFSQGVATAGRWIALGAIKPDVLVNWAGVFPEDLPEDKLMLHSSLQHIFVLGKQDQYWTDASKIEAYMLKLKEQFNNFTFLPFEGEHRIDTEVVLTLNKLI